MRDGTRAAATASSTWARRRPNDTASGSGSGGCVVDLVDDDRSEPHADPSARRISAVSISSLTGVVSGSVTSTTWQRSGRRAAPAPRRPGLRTGPLRTASRRPAGRRQERDGVAGGRPVDDDHVALAGPLELLDLAEHDEVVDARCGGADDVDHAGRRQAAWRSSGSRARRGTPRAPRRPRSGAASRSGTQLAPASACRRARPRSTRSPVFAAARASTAVTVVLPTPPLPATITSPVSNTLVTSSSVRWVGIDTASPEALRAQTTDQPAWRHRPGRPLVVGRRLTRRPRRAGAGRRRHDAAGRSRSTCCRSTGCSTRSWSTRSATPSTAPTTIGSQALILQVDSRWRGRQRRGDGRAARRDRRRPVADRCLGRPDRRPPVRQRRPRSWPSPTSPGMAPGAGSATSAPPVVRRASASARR